MTACRGKHCSPSGQSHPAPAQDRKGVHVPRLCPSLDHLQPQLVESRCHDDRRRLAHVAAAMVLLTQPVAKRAAAVGATVLLPEPAAYQVAKNKGTDWSDYGASQGVAATRAALRTAGL